MCVICVCGGGVNADPNLPLGSFFFVPSAATAPTPPAPSPCAGSASSTLSGKPSLATATT